jgi:hypothetical protein
VRSAGSRYYDAERAHLPVQVGPLNAERMSGRRHSPAALLQDGVDVLALEAPPGGVQRAADRHAA